MWFWHLIRLLGRLFFLRAKPEDIPYSRFLLLILCFALLVVKNISNIWFIEIIKIYDPSIVIDLNYLLVLLIFGMYLLILCASVYSVLSIYNVTQRTVQVLTSFVAMDLALALLFMFWLFALSLVHLPLQANTVVGLFLIIYFVMLLYWQFMVYIHIIFNSVNITILRAGIYALVYMLLQHNVAEILIGLAIKSSEQ